jgi:hypothetical protein
MVDIGKYIVYILYIHIAHLNVKGLFLPTEPISELMNWGPTFFFLHQPSQLNTTWESFKQSDIPTLNECQTLRKCQHSRNALDALDNFLPSLGTTNVWRRSLPGFSAEWPEVKHV